ncbi:MAG: folate-binding protein [Methylococcales bacterium]
MLSENARFDSDIGIEFSDQPVTETKNIFPVPQLAVLTVHGKDAAIFLQGQITCNIHDISESQSSIAAMCNAKGRVISTFILVKSGDAFLLLLPTELLEIVRKRLQMYVLRSDVVLLDSSDALCVIGVSDAGSRQHEQAFAASQQNAVVINLTAQSDRFLMISPPQQAVSIWTDYVNTRGFVPTSSARWRYLDILSGLPWLTQLTSEEFIPQMLNLDKLGGISFNKGCYTGQEVVARTHFLGQVKRDMHLAEAATEWAPEPNTNVINELDGELKVVGKVLGAQVQDGLCKMLIVLQADDSHSNTLKLDNRNRDSITLLTV